MVTQKPVEQGIGMPFFNIGWQFDPFIENPDTKNSYVAALKFSIKIGGKV